jgi:methionyl-tRNA synthetase
MSHGLSRVIGSEVLFSRLEDEVIETLRKRYSGSQQERQEAGRAEAEQAPEVPEAPGPEEIDRRFVNTLDLRVAQIVKIERHPKADKLYIETLEIAGEERIIVSGLVPFYREEELLGKRIIVAYNLKPAKLRGVESRGMLLAASDKNGMAPGVSAPDGTVERVEVLDAGDVSTGTPVSLDGAGPGSPPSEIDIDTFFTIPLLVQDGTVMVGGKALTLAGNPIKTRIIIQGEVH